jgi:hypothetical protein
MLSAPPLVRSCSPAATPITGFSHFSGLTVSGGRIYVGAYEGKLSAFSLGSPLEL